MVQPKYRLFSSTEWIFILVGLAVAVPLIFFHLGHLPLRIWDEARLAVNGYEMLQNHRFLVTTYEGATDLWNTKPPLLIWLQVLSMQCFGINEVAFRLPSVLAVFLTCVLSYVFLRFYIKDFRFGFIQNMVLLTTTGLFSWHGGKNGDYDALLMLFCGAYCLAYFLFLEKSRFEKNHFDKPRADAELVRVFAEAKNGALKKTQGGRHRASVRYIYLFYLCFSAAVLTKSSAALLFLPGLLLYTLLSGQLLSLLKNRDVYIGLLIPIVSVGGYYVCRELAEPGYLQAVWDNEFGGRLMTVIEEHHERPWFYIKNLYETRFSFWFFMALGGAVFGLFGSDRRIYRLTLFSVVLSGVYLLLISLARTKCFWYDIPLYPFLGVLTAVFIFRIFDILKKQVPLRGTFSRLGIVDARHRLCPRLNENVPFQGTFNRLSKHSNKFDVCVRLKLNVGIGAAYVFLFCLLTPAVLRIYDTGYIPRETSDWEVDTHVKTRYLRDMWRHPENMIPGRSYAVVDDAYHAHHLFYIYLLRDHGYPVRLTRREDLQAGDIVLCDRPETADFLKQEFETELLLKDRVLEIYDLKAAAVACLLGHAE